MIKMSDDELILKLIEFIEDTAKILDGAVLDTGDIQSLRGACSGVASGMKKSAERIQTDHNYKKCYLS